MIAMRFRSVYWVGGVAVAALGCYLVSQRVASERMALARTELAIVAGKRDIRALQTEIGTRAGMNQLERWNVDVLALSAPRASQFLSSEVQLAALVQPMRPAMAAPAVIQASANAPAAAPPAVIQAAATAPVRPAPPQITRVDYPAARRPAPRLAVADDGDDAPRVRPAVYMKPGRDHQNVALLDDKLLGDLDRIASTERAGGKRNR